MGQTCSSGSPLPQRHENAGQCIIRLRFTPHARIRPARLQQRNLLPEHSQFRQRGQGIGTQRRLPHLTQPTIEVRYPGGKRVEKTRYD